MSNDFAQLQALPDINFVDTSVEDMLAAAISTYETTYFNLTGQEITVSPGDDTYILLYSDCLIKYSQLQSINSAARQNFLKYATGNNVDMIAANKGDVRSTAQYSVTSVTFLLGTVQATEVVIPQGTRTTSGSGIYFTTDQEAIIPIGNTSVTQSVTCSTAGSIGNGYVPGQINVLVDSIPYVVSATNTETSEGGSDLQNDLSLAETVFVGNQGFSVAGPEGAYEYFARQYSSSVIDAKAISPTPGVVALYVLLAGGTLPNQTFLNELMAYIGADNIKPLTDNLCVLAPTPQTYDIALTYYIDASNIASEASIQAAVQVAVNNFVASTQSKLGQDVIPDQLTTNIVSAGAKRAVITSPTFTIVGSTSIATVGTVTVTYGGIDSNV